MIERAKLVLFACILIALTLIVIAVGIALTTLGWLGKQMLRTPNYLQRTIPFIRKPKTTVLIKPTIEPSCHSTPEIVGVWREHRDI